MTITLASPAALLHTRGKHFKSLTRAVLPFAGRYDALPFTHLHVEVARGDLRLICSDRHTLAIVREPLTAATADFTTCVSVPADTIAAHLDTINDETRVDLAIENDKLVLAYMRTDVYIPAQPSELPWRKIVTANLPPADVPTGHLAVDASYLARLGPAQALTTPETSLHLQLRGADNAIIATVGGTFLALIRPLTAAGAADTTPVRPLDDWFDLLDE
ncbi:hypothetical protein GCM10009733_008420 [Nonomuraea maheshkhaliensis]|uniref:DNA polymerase III beta sliding clamp central domain-containing protein n=1 Tax=Nonomuraea maheshkhaliensis TaxID=419590 RepID=A0ABP4QL18_9ACTN